MTVGTLRHGGSPVRTALVIVGVIFAIVWATYEVLQPITTDQGVFLWGGDVIRRGGVMYRDAWDTRGPMPYYFTALLEVVVGYTRWGFRFADLLIQAFGALLVGVAVRALGGARGSAWLAGILYLLWYGSLEAGSSAQPDGWVGVMLLLAVLALVTAPRPSHTRMFACGVLIGFAVLNKPTYGLFALLPLLYASRGRAPLRRQLGLVGTAALGGILPVAGTALYFHHEGALAAAIDVNIRYTMLVYGGLNAPLGLRITDTAIQLAVLPMALALPFVALGVRDAWGRDRHVAAVLGWWLLAAILNALVQHKPWQYEWLPAFAPFAVLTGLGIAAAVSAPSSPSRWRGRATTVAVAAVALLLAVAALRPVHRVARWVAHLVLRTPEDAYQASEFGEWGFQPGSVYGAAEYVREHTTPSQYALFWGAYAGGTFYAERPNPTRFAVVRSLVEGGGQTFRSRYRAEFMAAVQQRRPTYVVTLNSTVCKKSTPRWEWRCPQNFPEFNEWLLASYRTVATRGSFLIWHDGRVTGTLETGSSLGSARASVIQQEHSPQAVSPRR